MPSLSPSPKQLQRKSPIHRIARPGAHLLHKVALGNVQRLNHRRHLWTELREGQYDARDRAQAQYREQMRFADQSANEALEREAQADYSRRMVVISRYNRGPADLVGGGQLSDSGMQQSAYAASIATQVASPELVLFDQQQQINLAFELLDVPWPQCATIRSMPRRPGAPSFVLRLNH